MKVSVLIPSYKDPRLEKALASLKDQTYSHLEVLVIDGGSGTTLAPLRERYERFISLWLEERDRGLFDALNKGLRHATGDLIMMMGADDYWRDSTAISSMVAQFKTQHTRRHEVLWGVSPTVVFVNREHRVVRRFPTIGRITEASIYRGILPPHFGTLYSRDYCELCGLFDLRYSIASDSAWLLSGALGGRGVFRHCDTVFCMGVGGTSNSSIRAIMKANLEVMTAWRVAGRPEWWYVPIRKLGSKVLALLSEQRV